MLAEGEGVAARALHELGADTDTVRSRVMEQIGPGGPAPTDQIPFTPRAKKTMELSLQEALKLGHNYIGTEHLLLGLLRESEGMASQVLTALGIDLSATRGKVVQLLIGISASAPSAHTHTPSTPPATTRHSPALAAALAQATALAEDGLVGTQHVLAAFTTSDDAAAAQILEVGGFDASSLPVEISGWDVHETGDEDPIDRAARGTVVIQDASGMTVRLEDETLRERINYALLSGRVNEDQLRAALGRVWAEFAGSGEEPAAGASRGSLDHGADLDEPTEGQD